MNTSSLVEVWQFMPWAHPPDGVADAVRITSRYPAAHGVPAHVGAPGELGIAGGAYPGRPGT